MGGTEGEINSTLVVESAGDTLMTIMDLMKKKTLNHWSYRQRKKKAPILSSLFYFLLFHKEITALTTWTIQIYSHSSPNWAKIENSFQIQKPAWTELSE